ncbi:hypothetical protein BU26DRAFT_443779 [Trematosphaeria pertusa]|uniref:Lytic polysaccharide monooxygenase n=1 Tax=Trematosphaeria pertusa TaxID=390896 RepID=A0A6A6IYI3_9PLEO|nr:uncharacterized protein BU26DRAFT_443779 [Trematosphaeria pertusa]KAF2255605.1 hypothetical protein BU26DRAFT_443779 [Trematosphaeria pertusa]
MFHSRLSSLSAVTALLSLAASDPNSICYSYGVDFVDEGHYFINTLSNEQFTCVSTFKGCNNDVADVLFVDPNGDEVLCSQIPTTPEDTPELSTCPILKSQMVSGDWIILILGNNDDGQPFAWQRDLYLTCGPQATTTSTPTATFDVTSTPVVTSTSTSTFVITSEFGPTATFTLPSATAKKTKTITPKPVTTTATKTFTRTKYTWTKELSIVTKTETATCTTSKSKPDKPCTYSPTLLHPAALETPTSLPRMHRFMRKADRAVDVEYARARIEAAKLKRDRKARVAAPIAKRAPDEPTITITASPPVNITVTHTAPATTQIETTAITSTTTTTLPPVTVYSGIYTSTITLPTPTKTRLAFKYAVTTSTKTFRATWTSTTTITPSASIPACKSRGGHFGGKI